MISPSDSLRNKLSLSDCVPFLEGEFPSWWSDLPWWAGWAPLLGGLILVALVSEVRKAARKARGRTAMPERGRRS